MKLIQQEKNMKMYANTGLSIHRYVSNFTAHCALRSTVPFNLPRVSLNLPRLRIVCAQPRFEILMKTSPETKILYYKCTISVLVQTLHKCEIEFVHHIGAFLRFNIIPR